MLKPNFDKGFDTKIHLVNLSGMVDFSIVLYRIKWTSTCENRTTLKSKKGTK